MPTRRKNVPCHSKFDMKAIAQLFVSSSPRIRECKEAGQGRKAYNEWVRARILRLGRVNAKLKTASFSFHHEMYTDGVAVSLLYSKAKQVHEKDLERPSKRTRRSIEPPMEWNGMGMKVLLRQCLGKESRARSRKVIMVCEQGKKLVYSQLFVSKHYTIT